MSIENITFQRAPHDKQNPYAMVSNALIRDNRISPECRWLLIYLLSNNDNWKIRIKQIISHCKGFIGRDRVYAIIQEAIKFGYITVERGFQKAIYSVWEFPKDPKSLEINQRPENQDDGVQDHDSPHTKEVPSFKKEQKEESNVGPSYDGRLANYLLEKIKKQKDNFTGKVNPKWLQDAKKLLKARSPDELKKVIDWVYDDPFWSGVVFSPGNLLKNLDKIEMQMIKKTDVPAPKAEDHKKLAEKVKEAFPNRKEIEIGYNYIEFRMNRMGVPDPHLVFGENGFEEQLQNNLRKMGLKFNE